jgi:chorismate mutase / prephenate dehydratase
MGAMTVKDDLRHQLDRLRDAIDRIDQQLLRALNERMELAKEIGRIKADAGLTLFDPSREEAIYTRLSQENPGPLSDDGLRSIYREIMAASRVLQHPMEVAFLGPEWTYSHLAARSLFGHSAHYVPLPTLDEVFDQMVKGLVHVAIAPIENTLEGGLTHTLDLLCESDAQVIRECYLEMAHYLAGRGESLEQVERVYAHPQTLGQCRHWLLHHMRHAALQECSSTAEAARLSQKDPKGAAICNLFAAHHYGLIVLASRIEDRPGNITRFFALAQHFNPPTGHDKTSILFALPDRPGALRDALEPFTLHGCNLARIESRPSRISIWHDLFYADIEGHRDDPAIRQSLEDLQERVAFLKVLGSYPRSDPFRPIRFQMEQVAPVTQKPSVAVAKA